MPRSSSQVRRIARQAFQALGAADADAGGVPGLDVETIAQLIQVAGEELDYDCDNPKPSRRTLMLISDFGKRLRRVLGRWCDQNEGWLAPGVGVDEFWEEESGYAVLQTLRGEGVGIADGRWDHLFRRGSASQGLDSLRRTLERELIRFADPTGGGVLMTAFARDAELCAESDPRHELDDEDRALEKDLERDIRELERGLDREVASLDKPEPRRRR